MSRRLFPVGTLIATVAFLVFLFAVNPFARISGVLDVVFEAAPEWTLVNNLYLDPETQETSHGENPMTSFKRLSSEPREEARRRRVYLIGNSQTYTVLLARAEQRSATPEKTYPDLLNDFYRAHNVPVGLYRLAAPNITYMEVLWYLVFLSQHPKLQPDAVILQLNYETLRKSGVREGMLDMLDDPNFAAAVREIAGGGRPYSSIFVAALQKRAEQLAGLGSSSATATPGSSTGITESTGFGNVMETHIRNVLEKIPAFYWRKQMKADFEGVLYRLRVFLLHIRPDTPRSLSSATLLLNRSVLDDITQLCRQRGIELVLMNAPQNPAALLYRTAGDRDLYEDTVRSFAAVHMLRFYDFEHLVPASDWGVWIDGPDPIHFGRHGHQLMAQAMIDGGVLTDVYHDRSVPRRMEAVQGRASRGQ